MLSLVLVVLSAVSMPAEGTEVRVTLKTGQIKDGLVLHRLEKGFLLKTSAATESISLEQATSIGPIPVSVPEVTIVTYDGATLVGPATESATGYVVQTKRGKVSVPFTKIKEMRSSAQPAASSEFSAPPPPPPAAATRAPLTSQNGDYTPLPPPRSDEAAANSDPDAPRRSSRDMGEETRPAAERFTRFGFGLSGGVVPVNGITWIIGVDVILQLVPSKRFSLGMFLNFTHNQDQYTAGNNFFLMAAPTVWFGPYGLGALAGFGLGVFTSINHGWSGPGFGVVAAASPVKFKFGERVRNEIGLDIGIAAFAPQGVEPFGRIAYQILF